MNASYNQLVAVLSYTDRAVSIPLDDEAEVGLQHDEVTPSGAQRSDLEGAIACLVGKIDWRSVHLVNKATATA